MNKEINAIKDKISLLRRRRKKYIDLGYGREFKTVEAIKLNQPHFFEEVNKLIEKLGTITLEQGDSFELDELKNASFALIRLRNEDCISKNYNINFK